MQGFFFVKNKSSLIIGGLFRVDSVAVCEVEKTFEVFQFPLAAKLFYIVKNRSEIGSAASVDSEIFEIILPVFFSGNVCHVLYKAVTLYDIEVHFAEKILLFTEDSIGFFHETSNRVR